MTTQLHLAAQYLAAAGISFVDKKDDDSHTNLGFSIEQGSLYTRKLKGQSIVLSLNYDLFILEWNDQGKKNVLKLDGTSHAEVLDWIQKMAKTSNIGPYTYDLHYELPYKIQDDYIFKLEDLNGLQKLKEQRILTSNILREFLSINRLNSEIRIWPHHFDSGAFAPLEDESGLAVGLGLAIPDTMIQDYYFYISAYQGHNGIDTSSFSPLTNGVWKNDGFKGAVLPITGIDFSKGVQFFNEAFNAYKN
ncbi:hypothetical protein [Aquimarina sp. 2201CG5-10]|uniref:hypothetical protein n=1 Tax=Aquimarina callyspongiae TaxID=3098150 RepID=UPI002AB37FDF|nr:hypothetical protein [Aquimarina sp. 2201CG5-10]MDY8134545.1 hypothetical protein [Aquimarina sp. 2201CG5-10]